MKVLFAIVLTICTVQGGKKVCHEEPGTSGFEFKADCLPAAKSAARARKVPHSFESVTPACRATYQSVEVNEKPRPQPKTKPRKAEPVEAPPPKPISLTATAELCGVRDGTTEVCLRQTWRQPYPSRSACIAKGTELLRQGQRAFGYVRIPEPYRPTVRCLGETIAVPEASEPIIPPVPEPVVEIRKEMEPFPWRWTAFGLAGGAVLLGLVLWLARQPHVPPTPRRKK